MKTALGMVSLKHAEMKRSLVTDYVHDDTFSEMEEIPKKILNAIDSFNLESDEEFLGFE